MAPPKSAFQTYLDKRSSGETLAKMQTGFQSGKDFNDPRFYYPELDPKDGSGSAIIRFLPGTGTGDGLPYIRYFEHIWKNPKTGKSLWIKCPTSIGKNCPLCALNSVLYKSGEPSKVAIVSGEPGSGKNARKRKTNHVANILVVADPKNPSNEGQVRLFKFGAKILEKIDAAAKGNPKLKRKGFDVTDVLDGANFILEIAKKDGQTNYDQAQFEPPTPLFEGNQEEIQRVFDAQYDLHNYLLNELDWLTLPKLHAKLIEVLGDEYVNSDVFAEVEADIIAEGGQLPPSRAPRAPVAESRPAAPTPPAGAGKAGAPSAGSTAPKVGSAPAARPSAQRPGAAPKPASAEPEDEFAKLARGDTGDAGDPDYPSDEIPF